jgi:restriction system protein
MTYALDWIYDPTSAKSFIEKALRDAESEAWEKQFEPEDKFRLVSSAFFGSVVLSRLGKLTPNQFTQLVAKVLNSMGLSDVEATDRSGDGGIDGEGTIPALNATIAFQAKRWTTKAVGAEVVRNFIGAVTIKEQDSGVFVTLSRFTDAPKREAGAPASKVVLLDGLHLAHFMVAKGLGVQMERIPLGQGYYRREELDEEFFSKLQ